MKRHLVIVGNQHSAVSKLGSLRHIVSRFWSPRGNATSTPQNGDEGLFPAGSLQVALVTTFGVRTAALDAVLDHAISSLPSKCIIVCLTDQPDFQPLRRRGMFFEYLPPQQARSRTLADARTWSAYLHERYDILLAKWRPSHIVSVGDNLEQFLAGTTV